MAQSTAGKTLLRGIEVNRETLQQSEFENYEFVSCTFSDLSLMSFDDCLFRQCNLSNAKTKDTRLNTCHFSGCKLTGLNFSGVKDLSFLAHFEECQMDYCYFDKKKLNRSSFKNCRLQCANFSGASLSGCRLEGCDLGEAVFFNSDLSGLDLRSNSNMVIDPEHNRLQGARFQLVQLPGLLQGYGIEVE